MRIETSSRRAGELVEHAMADLEAYRRIKQPDRLNRAIAQLDEAKQEDPNYLLAVYGRAIADDLRGKAANAIEQLEQVFAENPPFVDDVEYHLGVAHYHRYNWANLDKAIAHLSAVAERTQDQTLECRARVALVQAFGMRMIPRDPRTADLHEIQHYFDLHTQEAARAEKLLAVFPQSDSATIQELSSVLHNAKGLGCMYWSDFFGSIDEKIASLKCALEELRLADEQNQDDWAICCDTASARMRLGYWRKSHSDIAQAREYLLKVVDELRPNYGFALYELGRSHRLCGEFPKAGEYFDRASAIPYEIRDVSDRRLLIEKERAEAGSKEYP
jgi:tetratricopeptide (TPR) repeat protein